MREIDVTFSPLIKEEIRREQQGYCFSCGVTPQLLEIHHKLPQFTIKKFQEIGVLPNVIDGFARYIRSKKNGVGLCHSCHEQWNYEGQQDTREHVREMLEGREYFIGRYQNRIKSFDRRRSA